MGLLVLAGRTGIRLSVTGKRAAKMMLLLDLKKKEKENGCWEDAGLAVAGRGQQRKEGVAAVVGRRERELLLLAEIRGR